MHAFLLHSQRKQFIEEKTKELLDSLQSIKLSYELKTIDQVREITKFTQLTAKQKSTIYIENIDQASVDAQNAFLKTLEEPQENISFILTCSNSEHVVPTILSRVHIIEDETTEETSEELVIRAQRFFESSSGEQLAVTSKIKKREEAIDFIKSILLGGHQLLISGTDVAQKLETAQGTFEALQKNGNVQIQLTRFVAQINQS